MDDFVYKEPLGAVMTVKEISNGIYLDISDVDNMSETSITIDKEGIKSLVSYLSKLVEEK